MWPAFPEISCKFQEYPRPDDTIKKICGFEACPYLCRWFGLASGVWGEALGVLALVYFYMPWLWQVSTRAVKAVGLDPKNEIYVTIAYFLIDSAKDTVLGLPWSLYSTFVIEERCGPAFACIFREI